MFFCFYNKKKKKKKKIFCCARLLNRAKDYAHSFRRTRLHTWRILLFVGDFCFRLKLNFRIMDHEVTWSNLEMKTHREILRAMAKQSASRSGPAALESCLADCRCP